MIEQSKRKEPFRVLLAEDHALVRETLALWLADQEGFQVVRTAASIREVTDCLAAGDIEIVLLDLALGDEDALPKIRSWRRKFPRVRFLVLSANRNYLIAKKAMDSGAIGFVSKSDPSENLLEGLLRAADGKPFFSDSISPFSGRKRSPRYPELTCREEEILREVAAGRTNRLIAERIGLSTKTIERHRENIKRKLKLGSSAELIREAARLFPSEKH